ncbi:MAG: hypothetical protein C4323_23545 [Mastigocladus sp. ERB_26_2]
MEKKRYRLDEEIAEKAEQRNLSVNEFVNMLLRNNEQLRTEEQVLGLQRLDLMETKLQRNVATVEHFQQDFAETNKELQETKNEIKELKELIKTFLNKLGE